MTLFLRGKETYESRQKLNEIVAGYKKANDGYLNIALFDFKENQNQEFKAEINSSANNVSISIFLSNPLFQRLAQNLNCGRLPSFLFPKA